MFETVLVAARGPLAVRVVRTCQRLGVRAVSVHSEADATARHVVEADDAVLLGPAPPEHSYLDRRRVLEAARQCGASAVHPGGGALAADAHLARAVQDAGLTWVGAAPEVLDRLGSDAPRRRQDRLLSVHLLAGPDLAPLAVLDVTPEGDQALVASAPPADAGDLGPAVAVAVGAAADSGLRGVASVQVLLHPDGSVDLHALRPWLPVEHPVSEVLVGCDLVEHQLLLAAGEPALAAQLPTGQARAGQCGLLLRVHAEPHAGEQRLTAWGEPSDVRVDSGCTAGDVVLPWYDPLLATVTVAGATREEVLARARSAVAGFRVEGAATTLPRLAAVLADASSSAA